MTRLTPDRRRDLTKIILDAFPSHDELEQMVRLALDKNLDAIARADRDEIVVAKLVTWAESAGRLKDLVDGAHEYNPDNSDLREFREQLTLSFEPGLQVSDKTIRRSEETRKRYLIRLKENITNQLSNSVHSAVFIDDIGGVEAPDATYLPWIYRSADGPKIFDRIDVAFEHYQRRVLLLGAPGSGKTTALLHIAMKLIGEAQDDPKAPIPLLVNLTKLQDKAVKPRPRRQRQPSDRSTAEKSNSKFWFDEWLVQIVTEQYALPVSDIEVVRYWVAKSGVSLLLDGFDEVNESQRRDFARILNEAFIDRFYNGPVVVCSRKREYEILIKREIDAPNSDKVIFRLMGGVVLQPLEKEQIYDYLAKAQASGLRSAILQDDALYELAHTPLTLSIMTVAYGYLSKDAIPTGLSLAEGRRHLFDAYVDYMMQRKEHRDRGLPFHPKANSHFRTRYRRVQVDRSLGWLAVQLSIRWQTAFTPNCLYDFLHQEPKVPRSDNSRTAIVLAEVLSYIAAVLCGALVLLWLLAVLSVNPGSQVALSNFLMALGFLLGLLAFLSLILYRTYSIPDFWDFSSESTFWSSGSPWKYFVCRVINGSLPYARRISYGLELLWHRIQSWGHRVRLHVSQEIFTPNLYFVLAAYGIFPLGIRKFLSYSIDVMLLKEAGRDLEFIHRMLRDHFATRELSPRLASRDPEVRSRTVEQLSLQGEASVEILFDLLHGGDPEFRRLTVPGICRIPVPEVFPALREALNDPDVLVRRAVVANAHHLTKQESVILWYCALGDADPSVRLMAYARIAESRDYFESDRHWGKTVELSDVVLGLLDPVSDRVSGLLDALRDTDFGTQALVMRSLGEIGDKRAIPALLEILRNQDYEKRQPRAQAAAILGKIGDASVAPALVDALLDERYDVHEAASNALINMDDVGVIPVLLDSMKSNNRIIQMSVARILRYKGVWWQKDDIPDDLMQILPLALQVGDEYVRWDVLHTLKSKGDERAVPGLLDALRHNDKDVRSAAAEILGELGGEQAISGLLNALDDKVETVRIGAARSLGKIGDSGAASSLSKALRDRKPGVRIEAARSLLLLGDKVAVPALLNAVEAREGIKPQRADGKRQGTSADMVVVLFDALRSDNERVRNEAAEALLLVSDTNSMPQIMDALRDRNGDVRNAAATALGRIRDATVMPALLDALHHPDIYVRTASVESLAGVIKVDDFPYLFNIMHTSKGYLRIALANALEKAATNGVESVAADALFFDYDPFVCCVAARILSRVGTAGTTPYLLQTISKHTGYAREAAIEALVKLADVTCLPILLNALSDGDESVRHASALALRQIAVENSDALFISVQDRDEYVRDTVTMILEETKAAGREGSCEDDPLSSSIRLTLAEEKSGRETDVPSVADLIRGARNDRWETRKDAVSELMKLGTENVKPFIWSRLFDPRPEMRTKVLLYWVGINEGWADSYRLWTPIRQDPAYGVNEERKKRENSGLFPAVAGALQDSAARVRVAAALALSKTGDASIVPGLLDALYDEDEHVKNVVADALLELADPSNVSILQKALDGSLGDIRSAIAAALGIVGDTSSLSTLLEDVHAANPGVRRRALAALQGLNRPDVVPVLLNALGDSELPVRHQAAYSLQRVLDEKSAALVPALLEHLREDDRHGNSILLEIVAQIGDASALSILMVLRVSESVSHDYYGPYWGITGAITRILDRIENTNSSPILLGLLLEPLQCENPDVRRAATWALGRTGDMSSVSYLLDAFKDRDGVVREAAHKALWQVCNPAIRQYSDYRLSELVSGNPEKRWKAIQEFGRITDAEVSTHLLDALKSKNPKVRLVALEILGRVDGANIDSLFLPFLKDPDRHVRFAAAMVLEEVDGTIVNPNWLEALTDSSPSVRLVAVRALGKFGDSSIVPNVLDSLNDTSPHVRREAALTLGCIGDATILPNLVAVLNDFNPDVRREVIKAIGEIGDASAAPSVQIMLRDRDRDVRQSAAKCLVKLADEHTMKSLLRMLEDDQAYVRCIVAETLGLLRYRPAELQLMEHLIDQGADQSVSGHRVCDYAVEALTQIRSRDAYAAVHLYQRYSGYEDLSSSYPSRKTGYIYVTKVRPTQPPSATTSPDEVINGLDEDE